MESFTVDLFIIFGLVVLNGFFSGSEIAIISFRKTRVQALIEQGSRTARVIRELQSHPDSFFATIQIGVTVVGTVASAFGGVQMVPHLSPLIRMIPYAGDFASEISFVVLVGGISYLTLVLGELVPKSLALHYSETFALIVAYPLHFFSRVFIFFTTFLTFSSNIILRIFKDRTSFSETRLSAEEIRHLLEEGVKAGTIERSEHEMIENVLDMNDTAAREVMIPRVDIVAIASDSTEDEIRKLVETYHSRLPVYNENLDNIIGILHVKDLMRVLARKEKAALPELLRPAYFVPESMKIGSILKEMQKRKSHIAIVVDEFGGTSGLLTMEDILEEIVGEIQDVTERPDETDIFPLPDGQHLVAGSCALADFNEFFQVELPESESYTSLAGFILEKAGRFPEVGERIQVGDITFELVKRAKQKLVQFRVRKNPHVEKPHAPA